MYESERFEFGAITLPAAVLPSPEEVRDGIEALANDAPRSSRNAPSIHHDSADAVVFGDEHDDHSYCHFQYRASLPVYGGVRSSGEESRWTQPWHVRSRVFYFENGQFAVQPTRGLSDTWLPGFIARITDTDVGDEFRFYGSTGNGSDARQTPEISEPSGAVGRVPADDGSASFGPTLTASDDRTTRSAGDPADLLAEAVEPHRTHGSTDPVVAPGTVVATWNETDWPNDAGETQRAKEIREQIVPYLRRHV